MVKNLIMNNFQDKTILITGGLGFVGVNLASALISHGIEPVILDYILDDSPIDTRYIPFNLNEIEYFNIDLTDRRAILDFMGKFTPDYVIHLASLTDLTKDFNTAISSVEVNIKGTIHLLESINKFHVTSFVFMSTSDLYGGVQPPFHEDQVVIPASPYSASKVSAEMYCLMFNRVFNLPVTILRSFNLFGKYQRTNRIIPHIILKLLKGQSVELTSGRQKREFNYVENLIEAIFLSLKNPKSHGKTINVGTGESISIRDIALKIARKFDLIENLKFGAIQHRPNEIWDMYCDNTRAKTILNWEPKIKLDEGLNQTIEWFQETFKQ
jgi:nucleoside-diphosphate-sugar epimerase